MFETWNRIATVNWTLFVTILCWSYWIIRMNRRWTIIKSICNNFTSIAFFIIFKFSHNICLHHSQPLNPHLNPHLSQHLNKSSVSIVKRWTNDRNSDTFSLYTHWTNVQCFSHARKRNHFDILFFLFKNSVLLENEFGDFFNFKLQFSN